MNKQLQERLFDSLVKLGKTYIIYDTDAQFDIIEDLWDDVDFDDWYEILGVPEEELRDPDYDAEGQKCILADYLCGKIICEVHTPVMERNSEGGGRFSWGYTHFTHIVGESLEEIAEKALKWAEQFDDKKDKHD